MEYIDFCWQKGSHLLKHVKQLLSRKCQNYYPCIKMFVKLMESINEKASIFALPIKG